MSEALLDNFLPAEAMVRIRGLVCFHEVIPRRGVIYTRKPDLHEGYVDAVAYRKPNRASTTQPESPSFSFTGAIQESGTDCSNFSVPPPGS